LGATARPVNTATGSSVQATADPSHAWIWINGILFSLDSEARPVSWFLRNGALRAMSGRHHRITISVITIPALSHCSLARDGVNFERRARHALIFADARAIVRGR